MLSRLYGNGNHVVAEAKSAKESKGNGLPGDAGLAWQTFGLVFLSAMLFDVWFRRFNWWHLVSGDFYLNRSTYLLSGRFPCMGTMVRLCFAATRVLMASTVRSAGRVEKASFVS